MDHHDRIRRTARPNRPPTRPPPAIRSRRAVVTDDAKVEPRDPSGGPTTLDWWLDDGPDSPIAADIKEPEKHL